MTPSHPADHNPLMTVDDRAVRELIDHKRVSDALYRYAERIDVKDYDGLRQVLTDDVVGIYNDYPPLEGADVLVEWIRKATADRAWQHHKLTVYRVDVDGDTASAVTYHTSHQVREADPDTVIVMIARYYDDLRRDGDRWLISRKVMETGWREERHAPQPVRTSGVAPARP